MARALARPIKTARDHKNASVIASKAKQAEGEPVAETRLKALLDALDKYDGEDEEDDFNDSAEDLDGLPRRRWSDDASDEA